MTVNTPRLSMNLPPFARRTTREWQAADAAHFLHPFTDHQALATKGVRVVTRGEGV
jgi:putrescine---pyruvate transaminase